MNTTRKIALLLRKIGLEELATNILGFFHLDMQSIKIKKENWVKHPTHEMMKSRGFFEDNKEVVEDICNLLADRKSRDVYRKVIKYRQTYDKKDAPEYSIKDQYFDDSIIKCKNDEVFIDCGAYNGDTIDGFIKYSGGKYKTIVALEPDAINYEYLKKKISKKNITDTIVLKYGAWNKNETLRFSEEGSPGSMISEEGVTEIHAVPLDEIDECKDASFIKMDIEGAEMNALEGAKNIIAQNRPKLAICLYHSDQDMISIPKWIHDNYPFYKLYIRQHHYLPIETVLYAIPGDI